MNLSHLKTRTTCLWVSATLLSLGFTSHLRLKNQLQPKCEATCHDTNIYDVCSLLKRHRSEALPFEPDMNLNFYPSRDGSHEFILCSYPKTGCSQWIMLLHYLVSGEKNPRGNPHMLGARQRTKLMDKSTGLTNASVPRILIMRDPYRRTISSYHDFRRRNPNLKDISFQSFIFKFVNQSSAIKNLQPTNHRMPISDGCSNPTWMHGGWDYVFQLEQMSLWLPCMLDMLNLTHIVKSGWKNTSLFRTAEITLPEVIRIALLGDPKGVTKSVVIGHENPTEDLHTPSTISVVNKVFFNDFVLGGYRLRLS